jgi:hypothetical protein
MGMAITILLTLYDGAMTMGERSRARTVATSLAQDQLAAIQADPGSFNLPQADQLASGEPVEITCDDGQGFPAPATVTVGSLKADREKAYYDGFSWKAYARQPKDAAHIELTVAVSWVKGGRPDSITLSTLVAQSTLEGSQ